MALTDGKERDRATDHDAAVPPEAPTVDEIDVAVDAHAEPHAEPVVHTATTEPGQPANLGAVRVAAPVRQPRRIDTLKIAYGVAVLLASIATGLTVGTAEAAGDAGSPYAPPPAVFVQTD